MLAGTVVAPGHAMALPWLPGSIAPQNGAEKQDCERRAAKRWLANHGERLNDLRPVYLGDDLFACQPVAEAIQAAAGDFLLTARPSSHKALYDFMQGATIEEHTVKQKLGGKRLAYRYRWFEQAPLRDGHDAMLVNWVGVTLAMVFAAMNLIAFAVHTACDGLEQLRTTARTAKPARKRFFEHIRTITAYPVFPNWQTLMQTLSDSKPPPDIAVQIAM